MSLFSHLIFGLSLPLGVLALLIFPFLILGRRGQTAAQCSSWGGAGGAGPLLGNALVCLVTLYAGLRLWRSRRTGN